MLTDKKISQLPNASGIIPSDISVLVDSDTTEQYSFSQLLTFLGANLQKGSVITFGTASIPSTGGNDGDVYVKTDTGQFAQKLSGVWTVVYTVVQGVVGSTIYYGSTVASGGINGDTYIQTVGGIFSKKIAGIWVTQFTMATGPTGPAGAAGTNGTNGTNGLTVLNGTINPSNLSDGVNGDFYINTTTWRIFGPKAGGVWPTGVSLIGSTTISTRLNFPIGTALPIVFSSFQGLYSSYGSIPKFNLRAISGGAMVTASVLTATTTAAAGTYTAQPVIDNTGIYNSTGVGSGATVTVVVSGVSGSATATSCTIVGGGSCYYVGDTFTIADVPGAVFTVATNSEMIYADLTGPGSIEISEVTDLLPDSVSINTDDDGTGHLQDNLQIVISL